ncbi:MAG: MmgE/PrpD family protein [Rhizobiaceae bacterium]
MAHLSFQKFLHNTRYDDLPESVQDFSRRCILDLVGVMIAGSKTDLAHIIANHSAEQFAAGGSSASIMFDGRSISPAGAALANGMMIDSVDAHDGYKETKGHIGCHVLPALLAGFEATGNSDSAEFLTCLAIGYEIGARAGQALHASVPDYHTSGAWGSVTAAALISRVLALNEATTRHAIGIGEYHGPRSQMMRCIDHPTMLKDGSGWGAMAGVSAAYLARSGFTGAPAITIEGDDVAGFWSDLSTNWTISGQYFKPYPVCRWAQPATEASLTLKRQHGFEHEDIEQITVHTFHEATRLATWNPETTEEAQYSLPFPVAAALVFGQVGPDEISGEALNDQRVLRLAKTTCLIEMEIYNEQFPAHRYAHVEITLKNGESCVSERHPARGDPEDPLSDTEIRKKFHFLSDPVVGFDRANRIYNCIMQLGDNSNLDELLAVLRPPA